MIYTLTLNPALDYIVYPRSLTPGKTNRSAGEKLYFGGKGINVSTVLAELGVKSVALGFVGGFTGEALDNAVKKRGITTDFVRLKDGMTRINIKLKGDDETEINAAGPTVLPDEMNALFVKLDRLHAGDTLVLAGSVPGSLSGNLYAEILARLAGRGIRFVVDAAGKLLTNTLPYRPFLIKPNRDELEEIAGRPLASDSELAAAAETLRKAGAVNVLVSLGGDGAMLVDESGNVHRQTAPSGKAVNTVGAGDSMVAGFLAGLENGYNAALTLAVAAGNATAFSDDLATGDQIAALLKRMPTE